MNINKRPSNYVTSAQASNAQTPTPPFIPRGVDRRLWRDVPCAAPFPLPLFSCDVHGAIIGFNEAAVELWGRRPDTVQPGQWSGAVALLNARGDVLPRSKFPAAQAFQTGTDLVGIPEIFERPDGSTKMALAYAKTARDADGKVCEVTCALVEHANGFESPEAARRAEDEKRGFITMLSHELRNPLSPILNAAVLMKKVAPDHQVSKLADVVERQANRLARFVQDLLHATHLDHGGAVLEWTKVSFSEVMQAALDPLCAVAASRKQAVSVELAPNAMLRCDAERLSQAMANVMVNASEFTGNGGNITVKASVEGGWARIDVVDDGIGIETARLADIFHSYTHYETHAERARSGAGVGLALAKDICEKHGGFIAVASAGAGLGSRFTLSLPIVVEPIPPR